MSITELALMILVAQASILLLMLNKFLSIAVRYMHATHNLDVLNSREALEKVGVKFVDGNGKEAP